MNDIHKVILGSAVVLLLVFVGIFTVDALRDESQPLVDFGGANFAVETEFLGGSDNAATTTWTYLTAGAASSTLITRCDGSESIDLNLLTYASGTDSIVQWVVEFSNSTSTPTYLTSGVSGSSTTAGTGFDWFAEDGTSVGSVTSVTHGGGHVVHRWTPGRTTEARKNIGITPVASKWCRVSIAADTNGAAIWMAEVLKKAY